MKFDTNQKTGVLYLLPALAVVGAWIMLLVLHIPPPIRPFEVLLFVLSENPSLLWLRWFLVLPLLYVALSAAYFTPIARERAGAIVLLVIGIVAALACWIAFDAWLATVATVPVFASYQSVREKLIPD